MSFELDRIRGEVGGMDFTIEDAVKSLLAKGHAIHGYSSGNNERVIKILDSARYSESTPLLGYGVDGTAERALGKALLTYGMREQQKIDAFTVKQFPEAAQGAIAPGRDNSKFDHIVRIGDFALFREGDAVVAASSYGGESGLSPLRVQAHAPLAAIALLVESYNYMGLRVGHLPTLCTRG